jgi:hypothetical protein
MNGIWGQYFVLNFFKRFTIESHHYSTLLVAKMYQSIHLSVLYRLHFLST